MLSSYSSAQILQLAELTASYAEDETIYSTTVELVEANDFAGVTELLCSKSSFLLLDNYVPNFNLLIALVQDNQSTTGVSAVVEAIVSSKERNPLKLKVLSNLFNSVALESKMEVLNAILGVAKNDQELDVVKPVLEHVDAWMDEWNVELEARAQLYLFISECGFEPSITLNYTQKYLELESNENQAKKAIVLALNLPTFFLFEELVQLEAVKSLSGPLAELLQIFVDKTLVEYNAFVKKNPKVIENNRLNADVLLTKIRILSIDTIACSQVGKSIKYDTIAKALEVSVDKVEFWVIDGILF